MLDDFAKALEMEEKMFEKVKAYLNDNPGSTLEDVADATDVRDRIILKWIEQGRIQVGGLPSSSKSDKDLLSQFRDAQSGMNKGTGKFDQATKKKGMHISDRKK